MDVLQLRLFDTPKPLLDRFGAEFFKRVPTQPGVYLMSGEREGLLYVGKAQNLRQRLNSYKHAQPGRDSRKVIRLVHQVRSITWEICPSPTLALLRENELLRLHKPKFNVLNTRPEHYLFWGVKLEGATLHLRLTKEPEGEKDEQLYGAFKNMGRVRGAFAAWSRLLWCCEHNPVSLHDLPGELFRTSRSPVRFSLHFNPSKPPAMIQQLHQFLTGESDEGLSTMESQLAARQAALLCLRRLHEQDLLALREFFRFGPARNCNLRHHCAVDSQIIQKAELDDLLVLMQGRK
jgi:excinuclease UvrABC nuclease subunit